MDKTVTTHPSNGIATKQSLPLPRTLFSEGGSVVFSELLAESTFRPERFALEIAGKKVAPPQKPLQQQECGGCQQDYQQDYQKNIQRGLTEQRIQEGVQNNKNEHARLAAQKQESTRQQEEYRSEQSDRLDRQQQPSFDAEQHAYTAAQRASHERDIAERYQAERREQEGASSRAERAHAAQENLQDGTQDKAGETGVENHKHESRQELRQEPAQDSDQESAQDSRATQEKEQHVAQGKEAQAAQDETPTNSAHEGENNKANDKLASETPTFVSDNKKSEEDIAATKGEDTLEHALTGLGDAEGIDVFALQDAYTKDAYTKDAYTKSADAKTTQPDSKLPETLAQPAATQEGGKEDRLPSLDATLQQRGTASSNLANLEETSSATAASLTQKGEPLTDNERERQALPLATPLAKGQTASVASVATPLPLSAATSVSAEAVAEKGLRPNAATPTAQTPQPILRAEGQAEPASTKSSENGAKESTSHKTAQQQNNALSQRATLPPATSLASYKGTTGTTQQAGGAATALTQNNAAQSHPAQSHPAQSNVAQSNVAQSNAANILAQALSGTGVRSVQGANAQEVSSLPEGIEVRLNQEVRAHRPEGLRLSGENALDSLRLARSAAQTPSYGGTSRQSLAAGTPSVDAGASSATLTNGLDGTQTEQAAAKLAARTAERQEAIRDRREATRSPTKGGTQALLQSLAARLSGARAEATGNPQQGGAEGRTPQSLGEARIGQTLGQALAGSSAQGSNSQGSNSDASLNNGFSQSLQGQSSQASARAGASSSPAFTTASSFVREQVFVNIQRAVEGKVETLTVKLRPELLGRIEIRLDGDAAGRLQIVVLAERSETLDLLQRDARQLEQALQDAGIRTQDQGLQFGMKGQGNAQGEGDAQQNAAGNVDSETTDETESDEQEDETIASAVVEKLQVRQDGRLNVEI